MYRVCMIVLHLLDLVYLLDLLDLLDSVDSLDLLDLLDPVCKPVYWILKRAGHRTGIAVFPCSTIAEHIKGSRRPVLCLKNREIPRYMAEKSPHG